MTKAARSAIPPKTAVAWATRDAIYCEIPCLDGPPYVVRYRRNASGLASAFGILIANEAPESPKPNADHPCIVRAPKAMNGHRSLAAREIVRRMVSKE